LAGASANGLLPLPRHLSRGSHEDIYLLAGVIPEASLKHRLDALPDFGN
jgi:hypothetical protein